MMIQSASQLTERERDFIMSFNSPEDCLSNKTLIERMNSTPETVCCYGRRLIKLYLVFKKPLINKDHRIYALTQAGRDIYNQLMEEK